MLCSCTVKGLDFSLWLRPGRNVSLRNAHGEEIKQEVVEEAHRNRLAVRRLDGGEWNDREHLDEAPNTPSTATGFFTNGAEAAPLRPQHAPTIGESSRSNIPQDIEHTGAQLTGRGGAHGPVTLNTPSRQSSYSPRRSPPVPLISPVTTRHRQLSPDSPPPRDSALLTAVPAPLASASLGDPDASSRRLPPIHDEGPGRPPGAQASPSPLLQSGSRAGQLDMDQEELWTERAEFIRDAQALSGVPLSRSYLLAMAAPTPFVEREVAKHLNNAEILLQEAHRELAMADRCLVESPAQAPNEEAGREAVDETPDDSE